MSDKDTSSNVPENNVIIDTGKPIGKPDSVGPAEKLPQEKPPIVKEEPKNCTLFDLTKEYVIFTDLPVCVGFRTEISPLDDFVVRFSAEKRIKTLAFPRGFVRLEGHLSAWQEQAFFWNSRYLHVVEKPLFDKLFTHYCEILFVDRKAKSVGVIDWAKIEILDLLSPEPLKNLVPVIAFTLESTKKFYSMTSGPPKYIPCLKVLPAREELKSLTETIFKDEAPPVVYRSADLRNYRVIRPLNLVDDQINEQ